MKREVSQDAQSSGGSWENYRLTSDLALRDAVFDRDDVADVSVQVDFPAEVITYDSDDETMGRKRFSAFRTKKGMPLYSKEDIREQYCITNKQLHVLETAQARKLFGCIPKEDNWKSCHRASLLSSCLRKTKSASDENLAVGGGGGGVSSYSAASSKQPMAWEPLPPEMQGRRPRAVSQQITSASVVLVDNNNSGGSARGALQQQQQLQKPQAASTKDLRQSFDEELANAVLRRRAKLTGDPAEGTGQKRHTWAVDGSAVPEDGGALDSSDGNLSRPTLLRLRSQDSGASITSDAVSIESHEGQGGGGGGGSCGNKQYAITMPNTPDLSHGVARRQMNKTQQDMTLDERRQKHVSFDCAALMRSHPTISAASSRMDGDSRRSQLDALTSPPMRRLNSSALSPDRNKSQERLLDVGTEKLSEYFHYQQHNRLGRRLGSVRSLDFMSGWSPKVHPTTVVVAKVPHKPMKTQATQTEVAAVPDKVSIPAPVLAYLTLSPRAHAVQAADAPAAVPMQSRTFKNGKRLVKSRSDSEYKIMDDSDMKMTVIHLDDTALLASKKRMAVRTRSSPLASRRKSPKEIMVTFKPQDGKNDDNDVNRKAHHHKLLKTCSEGSVLNREQPLTAVAIDHEGGSANVKGDSSSRRLPPRRERSESDPFLLEVDLKNQAGGRDHVEDDFEVETYNDVRRARSASEGPMPKSIIEFENTKQPEELKDIKNVTEQPEVQGRVPLDKVSLSSASRESEEYQSLTDPSTSGSVTSSSRSSASREIESVGGGGAANVDQSCSSSSTDDDERRHGHARRGRLRDGGAADEASSLSDRSSSEVDKTISYSSDSEFASIKSEESHTLVDHSPSQSPTPRVTAAAAVAVVNDRRSDDHDGLTTKSNAEIGKLKSHIKDRLTSPESESSSGKMRSKSGLSQTTDSSKSEETSEDYHTATEHSHAEIPLLGMRPPDAFDFGVDNDLSPFTVVQPLPSVATCVLEESPNGTMDTSHEFTTEEVSVVTVQEFMSSNLPSPRSPHASTFSIESSTSGSYTLDGSDPNLRKLSSETVSDSDKELETIFSSATAGGSTVITGGEKRDGGRAPIGRQSGDQEKYEAEEEAEEELRSTPTPEVFPATSTEQLTDTPSEKSADKTPTAISEVVESGYNFKEIRSRFERMLEQSSSLEGKVRSSSVETTDGTLSSSLSSDAKPAVKKKPTVIPAKTAASPVSRPTSFGQQRLERESFSKSADSTTASGSRSRSPVSDSTDQQHRHHHHHHHRMAGGTKHDDNKRAKEYRRSVSESPETSKDLPSLPSAAAGEVSGGDYVGGGAKSKRGFVEGADGHRAGKKHKSRGHDKSASSGHSKQKLTTSKSPPPPPQPEESGVLTGRSVSRSPDRWSPRCVQRSFAIDDDDEDDARAAGDVDGAKSSQIPDEDGSASSAKMMTSDGRHIVKQRSASSSSCTFDEGGGGEVGERRSSRKKRCERSLPGSTERLEDHHRRVHSECEILSKSLPERQVELFEVSKMLCTECGEKIRRIHVHDHHDHSERSSRDALLGYPMTTRDTPSPGIRSSPLTAGHLGGVPKYNVKVKSTPEGLADSSTADLRVDPSQAVRSKSVSAGHDSSTESLLNRRSPGSASAVFDNPALDNSSTNSLSWTATDAGGAAGGGGGGSQYASGHDVALEEEDEDVGIYAESYRASAWIYIGENEELIVWKGRPESSTAGSDKPDDDNKSLSSVASAPAALSVSLPASNPVDPSSMHRTDSLESTASEKEFRRRYQAITHRMIHRKSSVEMYKRLSNRTFECDKTVIVLRKSGEFGFRIHGSRPVVVSAIEPGTPAETSGLEIGDIVIAVNGVNVLDASHSEVVKIAHTGSETLHLDVARTCHILTPVVSDSESQRPVHCGFLYKTSGGVGLMRKWCRRWFVLKRDHCLYYYKMETSKEPLGAVMLLNYTVSRAIEVGRPHAFRVSKYGAASYCFAADDEDSMNTWANLINEASNSAGQSDPWIEVSSRNVQLPALSIYSPDCHGYLAKLGQRWKTWKRRYCVLKDACIYYYHDVTSVTSLGVAHLHGYRVQSCSMAGKKHAFEVIPPELKMRHLYFYADNDTDRKRWLAALEYSIDRWIKVG